MITLSFFTVTCQFVTCRVICSTPGRQTLESGCEVKPTQSFHIFPATRIGLASIARAVAAFEPLILVIAAPAMLFPRAGVDAGHARDPADLAGALH